MRPKTSPWLILSLTTLVCMTTLVDTDAAAAERAVLKGPLTEHLGHARRVTRTQRATYKGKRLARKINRLFIPLLNQEDAREFTAQMIGSNERVVLFGRPSTNYASGYHHYLPLVMKADPGEAHAAERGKQPIAFGSYYDPARRSNGERIGPHTVGSEALNAVGWQDKARYPVMRLSAPQIQSITSNLLAHHKGSTYDQNNRDHAALFNRDIGLYGASCMAWINQMAEVNSEGRHFARELQIKQGKPQDLPALMIHSALSRKVSIVGVAASSFEAFAQMTEAELMAGEPGGGAKAGMRPKQ